MKVVLERPIFITPVWWPLWTAGNGVGRLPRVGNFEGENPSELATLARSLHQRHSPVLIVDDEGDIRESLRGLLEDEGYVVAEAADGVAGLDHLRASAEPHVVLLDFKMPRMNGAELLQIIAADAHLAGRDAFILITANLPAFTPDITALLAQLSIPVVTKPFDLARLLLAVEDAERRLLRS